MNRAIRRRRRLAAVAALTLVAVAILLVVRGLAADTHGARLVRFTVHSRLVHRDLPVAAVVPAGHASGRRPLLVFLHGKGEDQDSNLDGAMYAALARQGSRAPDVVFPYGGADSYWHDRAGGDWGSYIVDELIPAATRPRCGRRAATPPPGPSTTPRTSAATT